VVQIVLWIVKNGCSKHMTGDRSLLRNFIEKFMGTVCFGNDNFAAIIGYGDYTHGNKTIYHVYYVEGLGHNLFSVKQFYDGDIEVAFRSKTWYWLPLVLLKTGQLFTHDIKKPYELLRGQKPNVEYFHMFGSLCYPTNDHDDLGKMKPKADIGVFIEADELHQEDYTDFDGNSQFVTYNPSSYEAIESSLTALEPSNVQNFHQVQPLTHSQTKYHPLDQVIGDPSKPVMTRQRLHTDSEEEGIDFEESFAPVACLEC
nr:integrase, catalytic region, zinc finger, CCHC-type, peptidase aspartic, catalytic [Tanacetum cinerariifolium]